MVLCSYRGKLFSQKEKEMLFRHKKMWVHIKFTLLYEGSGSEIAVYSSNFIAFLNRWNYKYSRILGGFSGFDVLNNKFILGSLDASSWLLLSDILKILTSLLSFYNNVPLFLRCPLSTPQFPPPSLSSPISLV